MSNHARHRRIRNEGPKRSLYDSIPIDTLPTDFVGRENLYRCARCNGTLTTVDRDAGVTPMFMACKATPGCEGRMVSAGYPNGPRPPEISPPARLWYRPTRDEYAHLDPETREHVLRGGLLLSQPTRFVSS